MLSVFVAYSTWMTALWVAYFSAPAIRDETLAVLAVTASTAIVYGVRRYRPRRARAWFMLAAVVGLTPVARIVYDLLPGPPGTLQSGIWVVWTIHLITFGLVVGTLLSVAPSSGRPSRAILDAAILFLGAGLLGWIFIAEPYGRMPGVSTLVAGASIGYVLRDAVTLVVLAYFATSVRWTGAVALLFSGLLVVQGYDVLFRLGYLHGGWLAGNALELAWLFFITAWGTAGLLPSMAALGTPAASRDRLEIRRLWLVVGASVLPFALLLSNAYLPELARHEPLVATAATIMLALLLARLIGVTLQLRDQVAQERALRTAVTHVATATDIGAIAAALRAALPRLLPRRPRHNVELSIGAPDTAHQDGSFLAYPLGPAESGRGSVPAAELALQVVGDRAVLAKLRPRLRVLATEASLAMDRMRLNRESLRRANEDYFRTLAQTTSEVILMVDDDDLITLASASASSLLGPSPVEGTWLPGLVVDGERPAAMELLAGTRSRRRLPPKEPAAMADASSGAAAVANGTASPAPPAPGPIPRANIAHWTICRADGSRTPVEVACRPVDDERVRGLVVVLRDVTEEQRLQRELTERALRDPLTGLASRLHLQSRIRQAVEGRVRDGVVGVLYLDLDDFKLVNDQFGYQVGDAVLQEVGRRLADLPSPSEAARLGGDQFALLVAGAPDRKAVDEAAARVLTMLAGPIMVHQDIVTCGATIGVATTADGSKASDLLDHASLALRAGKGTARGVVTYFDASMRSAIIDRLELRADLAHALERRELVLEYQPIVDLGTRAVAGFEALLRWRHPTRGLLPPTVFVELAEQSGLIEPIGDWVLASAMRQARQWERAAPEPAPFVAVNVSPRQLDGTGFLERVRRTLTEIGLAPHRLHLEITESALLCDDERTWRDLKCLQDMGVRVAIDDFGTGYSALSYLRRLPVDVIKLDRSFVSSMVEVKQQRELVAGIVRLTEILGLSVVAEGIETAAEENLAARIGCAHGQGFRFARPMTADATVAFLDRRREGRPTIKTPIN